MAYLEYTRHPQADGSLRLKKNAQARLGGCNNGAIAIELRKMLTESANSPLGWTIPLGQIWRDWDNDDCGYSFIVDIKPNNQDEVVLCEIEHIFGYSYPTWTPVMLRMKELVNDDANNDFDKQDFLYPQGSGIVYTFLYLSGTINDGKLFGTWNFPRPSSTNALLLYPEAMSFFFEQIKKYDPGMLDRHVKWI